MKKIILLGLATDPNIGDGIISDCTEKLVNKIIAELGASDWLRAETCDIRGLDFRAHLAEHEKRLSEIKAQRPEKKRGAAELCRRAYCRVFPRSRMSEQRREERKRAWEEIRRRIAEDTELYESNRLRFLNAAAESMASRVIDDDTAAVIVVGGGLIKYGGHQQLAAKIAPYIRRADEKNIPVMFSAVGVEGYDGENEECRLLAEALNLPCVRMITVRDDIDTLRDKYIVNKQIELRKVPCPACWVSELYPVKKSPRGGAESGSGEGKAVIGLGMARGRLFLDNGTDISPQQLDDFWSGLIAELEKRGYDWKIFTNGYSGDQHYAVRFLEKQGYDEVRIKEKLIPPPDCTERYAGIITSFDGIIAVRLHAAITAYSYGVPAVEPVWNIKQTMFGEWIGTPESFIPADSLEPSLFADRIEERMAKKYPDTDLNRNDTYDALRRFITEYASYAPGGKK